MSRVFALGSLILLTTLISKGSTGCVTFDECIHDIEAILDLYDERYNHLEFTYDGYIVEMAKFLTKAINDLNQRIDKGPEECDDFIFEGTLKEYVKEVNKTCPYKKDEKLAGNIFEDFRKLDPHFYEFSDASLVTKTCHLLVAVFNGNCQGVERQIEGIKQCDYKENFYELYEEPWEDCVASHSKKK